MSLHRPGLQRESLTPTASCPWSCAGLPFNLISALHSVATSLVPPCWENLLPRSPSIEFLGSDHSDHFPTVHTNRNTKQSDFPGAPVLLTSPSNAGSSGSILVGALRSHRPKNQSIQQRQCRNKFNKVFFFFLSIKKKHINQRHNFRTLKAP